MSEREMNESNVEIPIEQRFKVLCEIVRAQHFAWREAVLSLVPDLDGTKLANRMWEITGVQTAKAYLRRIEPDKPLAVQVARSIRWSSICMGEDVSIEEGEGDEAFVRHGDCPWFHWHKRLDILAEDRPGCDVWFKTVVAEINKALGTKLQVETQGTLPDGDGCCLRRIWVT